MTNSIASTKCLPNALSTGNYGMSQSHRYTDDSKEYIIVKLTDSAFRAIEEYQRDDNAKRLQPGQRAKIQFAISIWKLYAFPFHFFAIKQANLNYAMIGR